MSTLYTPQSNGIVERFMGYLKTALITLISNRPKKWDLFLATILFAYRAIPHPETGETPFFLNKGYDPVLPQIRALDMPDADPDQEHWLSKLQAIRKDLEQRILE